nr:unnamed protein product [Callosobruchus analis]
MNVQLLLIVKSYLLPAAVAATLFIKLSMLNTCAPAAAVPLPPGDVPLVPRLWVRLCLRRSQFRLNTFPHAEQLYGLISVWVSRWVFRLERWLKDLLHTGHLCGDSSIWRILWTAKVRDWQKPFPHSVHLKGFSLLWMYLQQKHRL